MTTSRTSYSLSRYYSIGVRVFYSTQAKPSYLLEADSEPSRHNLETILLVFHSFNIDVLYVPNRSSKVTRPFDIASPVKTDRTGPDGVVGQMVESDLIKQDKTDVLRRFMAEPSSSSSVVCGCI
jgi:hypothetical protein